LTVLPFVKLSLKKVVAADAAWTVASRSKRGAWGDFIVIFRPGVQTVITFPEVFVFRVENKP
jgi:hypothetical protein